MDIVAFGDGKFGVGVFFRAKYEWKEGGLSVWSDDKKPTPVQVTTNRGTFIEAIDADGNVVVSGGDGNWLYVPVGREPLTLRYKTLPEIALSKSALDKKRMKMTRYLIDDQPYSAGVPDTLPETIKWLQDKLAEIPVASRKKAVCRFDTSMSYGETYPHVEISYEEPETDDEVRLRLQIEAERAAINDAHERAKLAKLKAKYEAQAYP